MNSALRTSRLRKNAIPGLGRAGLQPRRKSRPNIYNKLSCGRRYGGAESPALPRLEIPFFSNLLERKGPAGGGPWALQSARLCISCRNDGLESPRQRVVFF